MNSITLAAILPVGRFRIRPQAPSALYSHSRMTVWRKLGSASCGIDTSIAGASVGRCGVSSSITPRSYDGTAPGVQGPQPRAIGADSRGRHTSVGEKPSDDGFRR